MDPVKVSTVVARSREDIYTYLLDMANHSEFSDHYLVDWHLTRENSYGQGAGARFRTTAPLSRYGWADATIVEVDEPYRIVEYGRGGKVNRTKITSSYTLTSQSNGLTKVEFEITTEPGTFADRIMESLGQRRWLKRNAKKALRRLQAILEEDDVKHARGGRVTVAGL